MSQTGLYSFAAPPVFSDSDWLHAVYPVHATHRKTNPCFAHFLLCLAYHSISSQLSFEVQLSKSLDMRSPILFSFANCPYSQFFGAMMPIWYGLSQLQQCSSALSGFESSLGALSCSLALYYREIIAEMICYDGVVLRGTWLTLGRRRTSFRLGSACPSTASASEASPSCAALNRPCRRRNGRRVGLGPGWSSLVYFPIDLRRWLVWWIVMLCLAWSDCLLSIRGLGRSRGSTCFSWSSSWSSDRLCLSFRYLGWMCIQQVHLPPFLPLSPTLTLSCAAYEPSHPRIVIQTDAHCSAYWVLVQLERLFASLLNDASLRCWEYVHVPMSFDGCREPHCCFLGYQRRPVPGLP